ncbi:beta-ketoacyl-ACP synthase 3 [Streptomyces beigongshangae]|uniref:beta-ketoacyl-ACP synthase 3 n=1 Tax=Streptomyces beigongshangae TaxID=2841597 RepID=UPI001C850604|nr:beta-ketoacyl-ACP synthase 3 [Streptomyces sp. REN17]
MNLDQERAGVAVAACAAAPSPGARIMGLGAYRPVTVVTNAEAARHANVDPQWIEQRVGIRERRHAHGDETVVAMAAEAADKALADAGVPAAGVDVVILATCSMPTPMPNGAASVAARIGCEAAAAFDLNAACSGFSHGLAVADALVRAGTARRVLVVASERMSDWVSAQDRATGPIFADGAAAALVVRAEQPEIFTVAWGSDGHQAGLISVSAGTGRMEMAGRKVFRWTTTALLPAVESACRRAGIAPSELKAFVPHQANLRIIDALSHAIDAPGMVTATDVTVAGNTCAASVPLAFHTLRQSGRIHRGDPVLLFGFGAGLTYAAQVVLSP